MVTCDRSLCQVGMDRVRGCEMLRRVCRSGHQGVACSSQDMVMWVQSLGKGLWTLGLCLSCSYARLEASIPSWASADVGATGSRTQRTFESDLQEILHP